MQDIRITKTKQMLKMKLIELLDELSFDRITVSDLCRRAFTSRVTFYTHYDDKYALVDDMMEGYYEEAVGYYHEFMQLEEYRHSPLGGYTCLLLAILKLYDMNPSFFKHVSAITNPYLYSAYYKLVYDSVVRYIDTHHEQLIAQYPARETAALLCGGIWSVIAKCYSGCITDTDTRQHIIDMYHGLLRSGLFRIAE